MSDVRYIKIYICSKIYDARFQIQSQPVPTLLFLSMPPNIWDLLELEQTFWFPMFSCPVVFTLFITITRWLLISWIIEFYDERIRWLPTSSSLPSSVFSSLHNTSRKIEYDHFYCSVKIDIIVSTFKYFFIIGIEKEEKFDT